MEFKSRVEKEIENNKPDINKIVGNKANNMTELLGDFFNNINSKPEIIDKKEYINAIQNTWDQIDT